MGAFDKQPINFSSGKGWFKNLQQFALDSHVKIFYVDTDSSITLVNGWQGWLSVSIFSFDNGRQFRLFSGKIHNPNIGLENGKIYKVATIPDGVAGYVGYTLVGAGADTWFNREQGMLTDTAFYLMGESPSGKDTWFTVSGLASY